MVRAGYNSQGASDAFAKLQAWEALVAQRPGPRDETRVELEREVGQSAQQGNFNAAIQNMLKMFSLAAEEVADEIAVSHRSAAAREESLLDYFFREYAEEIPPDSSVARLEAIRSDPEGQEFFGSYRNAWDAIKIAKANDGKLAEAEKLARMAVGGRYKHDSLARYAFFQTRMRQGQSDKARKNLELALEGPRPSLAIYRELADIHWAQGRRAEAMELLRSAFEEFQKPPELYADLIYRHYLLGDRRKAEQMAIQCRFRNRQAGEVCGKAAKGQAPRPAKGGVHAAGHGKGPPGGKAQDHGAPKAKH
jgi:tetratricopeptide (TPR) repeat protein